MGYISENAMKQISESFGRRIKNSGVTRIQWIALYYIQLHVSISQRELSKLLNVQDSSAGRLLDRLERDGLVIRKSSETDRRITMISLTAEGDRLATSLMPLGDQFNDDLTEGISEEELRIFSKVLNKMISNVSEDT